MKNSPSDGKANQLEIRKENIKISIFTQEDELSENHKVRFSIECSSINISFAATADGKIKSLEVYGKTYPDCLMYSDKTYRLLPVLFTQEPNKDTGATSYFKIL